MTDIPIAEALILWNSAMNGGAPAFAVRPLGHDDYYRYDHQNGACLTSWRECETTRQMTQLMIELWHVTAFHGVPADLMRDELLRIPEYRAMLADDCLPKRYRHERD